MRKPTIREQIPSYLRPFIAEQDSSLYTAMDHASWRYIMRVSKKFFSKNAHAKYLLGLEETGISSERIPLISEMDEKLQTFGWRAVPIVGFIPPSVFMEFLSLGILPIACDMRRPEHLAYTPAPDIVHEAAGHAPIIADVEYADYLHAYGEIAPKVIFSDQDMAVYEAIRKLSDTKEDPKSTQEQIQQAQRALDECLARVDYDSEATELGRMGWWTIEYGLVGSLDSPKIYGAGLLSSVSESFHCFDPKVKKIPFTEDCIKVSYDITKPQPQLFVTPDFQTLHRELDKFASKLAFRVGGVTALNKAKKAQTVTTAVFDSGVQVSGILSEVILDSGGQPCYLIYKGPCQLSEADRELQDQGAKYHKQGFGTPIGKIKKFKKSLANLTSSEIESLGGRIEFQSGVVVEGKPSRIITHDGKNLVLVFEKCTVRMGERILFNPDWGTFDLACGDTVVSVFGGAADRGKYLEDTGGFMQKPSFPKTNLTSETKELNDLYARLRSIRESGKQELSKVQSIQDELDRNYPNDWLLRLELLEFKNLPGEKVVRTRLGEIKNQFPDLKEMIDRGLALV